MLVEDDGAGFDSDQLHEGGQPGGVGLFGITERLSYIGGKMEVDSAPSRGSRFRLIAPISGKEKGRVAIKEAQVSVAILPPEPAPAGLGKRIRIMLVDDHMVMRQGLAGLLRGEPDFEISGEASDGTSAVNLARELRPDVILMDINMPGMDGIKATRIIYRELPGIHIIGLSMFQEGEQEHAMREAGAVGYLTKSGPSDAVIEAIRHCMEDRKANLMPD
jgi:CheY-like chemotaxis protein